MTALSPLSPVRPPRGLGPHRPGIGLVLCCLLVLPLLVACAEEGSEPDDASSDAASAEVPAGLRDLPGDAQAISLLGDTLRPPAMDSAARATQEAKLDSARADLEANPEGATELIWVGRRLAYLGRYREAIETYSRGIELHPDEPRLYRHRGHRWITLRRLDRAVEDLGRAAELIEGTEDRVEPDGLPNERGVPTSTLHFNIWYHLGLAHYLRGDFEAAADAYEACLEASKHPDSVVATTYWYYLTLRRLGRDDEARALLEPIHDDMDLIESTSYHRLLKLYKGELLAGQLLGPTGEEATLQSTTTAYGVGANHLVEGRNDEAYLVFRAILRGRDQWPAFGYIAAEAELARMQREPRSDTR